MEKANFEAAVKEFREFLEKGGLPGNIVWVWPEDVLATGKRFVYVRVPVPEGNAVRAREMHEAVMAADCGLRLDTLCEVDGVTCCYLWGWPKDHEEQPQSWPFHGLMMSVKKGSSRIPGKPVRNGLRWAWLTWWHRSKQGTKELMFQ
jgi:hypothetical protein